MSTYTPVTAPEIKYKTPGESKIYSADFERDLEDGEVLSSGAGVVEDVGDGQLTISEVAISGTKVQYRAAGGTANVDYELIVSVTTSNPANLHQLRVRLLVRDQ